MAIDVLLILGALLLDGAAIVVLIGSAGVFWAEACFLHAVAVVPTTAFAYRNPLRRDKPWHGYQVGALALGFLCLPLLGLGVWLLALGVMRWFDDWHRLHLISWLEPLRCDSVRDDDDAGWRTGFFREQLIEDETPLALRLKALMAVRDVPPHYSSATLRGLLGDQCDDVRLLACGVLELKEKALDQRIYQAQQSFQRCVDDSEPADARYTAARELAELYWEQVYQGLAHGDARKHALAQAEHYALEALHGYATDGGLRALAGRVRLLRRDHQGAAAAFSSALALGFPAARAKPYLAELAFLQHDYRGVRRIMANLEGVVGAPKVRQAAVYWK